MRLFVSLLAVLALVQASPATAAELAVRVSGRTGAAVADAVVMVRPQAGVPRGQVRFGWPYRMAQRNTQFEPFVLIVPVGAEVAFPNLDPFRHHVYSFSPAKTFELKLYSRDETRMVKMDKAGVVGLGCNIHDDMTAFIRVVDTPYAAKTSARGDVLIRDLPPGPATIIVWHPYAKAPKGEVARQVTIPASGVMTVPLAVDLRPAPMRHGY